MDDVEERNFERTIVVAFFAMLFGLVMALNGRLVEAVLLCTVALGLNAWWGQQLATRPRETERERLAFRLLEQISAAPGDDATDSSEAA